MEKVEIIVRALSDKLGKNIVALDMREASPIFDTFVLCTGSNERLLQALKDNVEDEMAKAGFFVKKIEGLRDSKWLLLDFGDVVVHLFEEAERDTYNLEKLWGDMPRISVDEYL